MKAPRHLLHQAFRPALSALSLGAPSRLVHGAVLESIIHVQINTLQLSLFHPSWLAHHSSAEAPVAALVSKAARIGNHHSLLLSQSPNDGDSSNTPREHGTGISDHEYQTRVGKACRVIVDSLPDFMHKGVVDLKDLEPECASSSSREHSGWSAKKLLPSLSPFLGQSLLRRSAWGYKGKAKSEDAVAAIEFDSLYHPSIAFEFRPPVPHLGLGKSDDGNAGASASKGIGKLLNASENPNQTSLDVLDEHSRGGPTIYFNGRTLYVASSHLLRHALSALFHDTSLHLESARFEGRSTAGSAWPGISPYIRHSTPNRTRSDIATSPVRQWHDKLVVRLRFEGISRVTSHPHTYTVIFKYEFDRNTGMIARHVVDNVQPVPGSKVWAGLTNAWGTLSPCGATGGGPAGAVEARLLVRRPRLPLQGKPDEQSRRQQTKASRTTFVRSIMTASW
ncbi:hypothetical protein EX895_005479 [Sporisorium graminicola]|uniref:Uncharacterized protein n=1 Tax=Sporisorium graminicola TaxID=280036 RepID=A0A4U7KN89_9BASI|nr:hypothetical protein EX895_005479 [Sporisorium graminicola]TKY85317.1 hypothetical protein EX895_005479 [Sporisorium graminicola]